MVGRIIIENFGGINKAEIELNSINVFIGETASGKSITIKLIHFFNDLLYLTQASYFLNKTWEEVAEKKFRVTFPPDSWPKGSFCLKYRLSVGDFIKISHQGKGKLNVNASGAILAVLEQQTKLRASIRELMLEGVSKEIIIGMLQKEESQKQIFIPAGRSFFQY